MDLGLGGSVALVTGGSRGLGRACALALAREGCASVAIVGRSADTLSMVGSEIRRLGAACLELTADVRVEHEVERVVATTAQEFSGIDVLVACAGGAPVGGLFELTSADWAEAFNTKILAYQWVIRAAVPYMQNRPNARIILMSGNGGKQPSRFSLAIGAFGAAINNLTRGLVDELAPLGIGIVAVCPGPAETERWPTLRRAIASKQSITIDEAEAEMLRGIPMGRLASPEEVGDLVTYLASGRARHITGTTILIDGGATKAL